MNQLRTRPLLLSLISGILLLAGWPVSGFAPLLLIAFVPLLFLDDAYSNDHSARAGLKVFGFSFISFLTWNTGATWWIFNSTSWGSVAAFAFNALFMAAVFWLFHVMKKKWMHRSAYYFLPVCWIAFEYLHLNWDLSWPWLTLGNGFSSHPAWVQWYEYTGVLGGTLWILIVNILVFIFLNKYESFRIKKFVSPETVLLAGFLALPFFFSFYLFNSYQEKQNPVSVVIVQPNIDPYNEKFSDSPEEQIKKFIALAAQKVDSNTDFLIGPETALPDGIWEENILVDPNIILLKKFISLHPSLRIIVGIGSQKAFKPGEVRSATARKFSDNNDYYDAYNTAIQLDTGNRILIYHKSKLVPGVEKMPYPRLFGFLEKFALDLGGTTGSLGIQEDRSVFGSPKGKVAPVICYESVYGDFLSGYIRNGADFIAIITNDGWWGDTPGYHQHLQIGSLRAIEFRRSIVRSANTGTSCFIDQRGTISQPTKFWVSEVIQGSINRNERLTFYSRFGDYIGNAAEKSFILSFLYFLFILYKRINH